MKKDRTFSLRLILSLIVFLCLSEISFSQNCLKLALPHDPDNGYFNPDSVIVDTCLSKVYAKGDYQIIFRGDPFKVPSFPRDTAIYRTWEDLDSNYANLKLNLGIVNSKFGNFTFVKVFPDITDSSRMASGDYYVFFDDYFEIDSVCKYLKLDSNVVQVFYVYRNSISMGTSTPNDPGIQYGELIADGIDNIVNNLFGDGNAYYTYKNPSLGWHIPSMKLPMAWEITKGKQEIKYLIVDHLLGPKNESYTYEPSGTTKYYRTTFELNNDYFKEYGHGLKHYQNGGSLTDDYGNYENSTGDLVYFNPSNDVFDFFGNCSTEGNIFLPTIAQNGKRYSEIGDGIVELAQLTNFGNNEHGFNIASIAASKHNGKGIAGVAPNCLISLCCMDDFYNLGRSLGHSTIDGRTVGGVDVDGSTNGIKTPPDVVTMSASVKSVRDKTGFESNSYICDIMKNGSLVVLGDRGGDNSSNSTSFYNKNNCNEEDAIRNAMQSVIKSDYKALYFVDGDPIVDGNGHKIGLSAFHMYWPGNINQSPNVQWDPRMNYVNPNAKYLGSNGYYDLTSDKVDKHNFSTRVVCKTYSEVEAIRSHLYEVGNTNDCIIQRPRLNIGLDDVIMPRGGILACNIADKDYGEKIGMGSYTIPIMGGILSLMRSVDKYLGAFTNDNAFNNANDDERLNIARNAYSIVTFTTYKVNNNNVIYPHATKEAKYNRSICSTRKCIKTSESTVSDDPIVILGDPLDRWYSNVTAFGKVNAFRCVMHSIPAKAKYEYNKQEYPSGLISLDDNQIFNTHELAQKHFIHFGSLIKEDVWVNELYNIDNTTNKVKPYQSWDNFDEFKYKPDAPNINHNGIIDDQPLNVLEWGGRHFPGNTTEPWKNNWGETILKDGITITVPDNYVACIDGILRQPNEDYELSPSNSYTFTENKFVTSGSGKILFTGFLRDIELNGFIKLDDLDIHTSALNNTNNIGRITVKNNGSENSEIFGKVNVYDNSSIGFGTGTGNVLVLQPGGEILLKGSNGIIIPNGATLELAYSSAIKKDPENTNDVKIIVQQDGILKVLSGAAVTLDIPIEVEDGGKVIFEDHTLAWIDNIVLKKGGKIISEESGTELTKEVILIPAEGKTGKIILEAEAELTINNAVDNSLPTKPIALVGGVILRSGPYQISNEITKELFTKFTVKINSKIDLGNFSSEAYTTIKFNPGSDISLLADNNINSFRTFHLGLVTNSVKGELEIIGSTIHGFDATDRHYNGSNINANSYVLAQIKVEHGWLEFLGNPIPINVFPIPVQPPLHYNTITLNNSTFKNVTFKLINAIKLPIVGCNFEINGEKIRTNIIENSIQPYLPTSIIDVSFSSKFGTSIFNPTVLGDPNKVLNLDVLNSNFKNTIDPATGGDWFNWLTSDINISEDNIPDYKFHFNGISAQNMYDITVNGNALPTNSYKFEGLNMGISSDNCRTVTINYMVFNYCRLANRDYGSSVTLCHNLSNRVNTVNSLNNSKRSFTSDNFFLQSSIVTKLFNSEQSYVSNSFNDFYNGAFIDNSSAIMRSETSMIPYMVQGGSNSFDIPDPSLTNIYDKEDFPNENPFITTTKLSFTERSDIFLNHKGANLLIDYGLNNMAQFTPKHIFYRNSYPNDIPAIKSIDLRYNNWRDGQTNHILKLQNVSSLNGNSYIDQGSLLFETCSWNIVPLTIPYTQYFEPCDFFVRNTGKWPSVLNPDTVLDDDFYAYLDDFCNGILSCECYKQRLFDLMQLSVLGDSVSEKLQMVIDCITNKNSDPVYSYLNCDATNLLLLLGEAYERTGLIDDAVNIYLNIVTNSANPTDTMLARWRLMNLEAIQADTTFGSVYDSLMSDYYQRVDRDITSTTQGGTQPPPPPPAIMQNNGEAQHEPEPNVQNTEYPINSDEKKNKASSGFNPDFNQNPNEADEIATLEQNTPNPFTNETVIVFHLNREADVRLGIHNSLGHTIKEVVNQRLRKGKYVYTFQNENNASGVYLYLLTTDGKQIVKKMQLVK